MPPLDQIGTVTCSVDPNATFAAQPGNFSFASGGTGSTSFTFTPPATAGHVVVTYNAASWGAYDHPAGAHTISTCCVTTSATASNGTSIGFNIHNNWPAVGGGGAGIEYPLSVTSSFTYTGGAVTAYLRCSVTGDSFGGYVSNISATAISTP